MKSDRLETHCAPDDNADPGNGTLTKADITERVYRDSHLSSRREAANMVDDVLARICDAIAHGEYVKLSGFGTFRVIQKNERIGRNPATGVSASITARKVVQFNASPLLKKAMNREQKE